MKNKNLLISSVSIFSFYFTFVTINSTGAYEGKKIYIGAGYGLGIANKIGSQYKLTHDSSFPQKRPRDSQIFSLALGYKLGNNVRAELAFNQFSNFKYQGRAHYTDYSSSSVGNKVNYEYKQKLRSNAFFANFYYDFNQFNKFAPYVNMGLGLSKNKSGTLYVKHKNVVGDSWEIANKSEARNQFAWNVGIGIAYKLNDKICLDLINYKYNDLGKFSTKEDIKGDRMVINKLKVHSISTGIRMQF
ncbi:MAG: outer membrane protein [Candidatus Midichloriaceae bacterium]